MFFHDVIISTQPLTTYRSVLNLCPLPPVALSRGLKVNPLSATCREYTGLLLNLKYAAGDSMPVVNNYTTAITPDLFIALNVDRWGQDERVLG